MNKLDLEALDELDLGLRELKVKLRRKGVLARVIELGFDVDKYIKKNKEKMRSISSSKEQYLDDYRIEVSD